MQLNLQHAVETTGYRWNRFQECLLCELDIECDAILITDSMMGRFDVSGAEKAAFLKGLLQISEGFLLEELGKRNLCMLCLESPNEFELIVPHALIDRVVRDEVRSPCAIVGVCFLQSVLTSVWSFVSSPILLALRVFFVMSVMGFGSKCQNPASCLKTSSLIG